MPSYFYHIALELYAYPRQTCDKTELLNDHNSQTSLSFDSACEALLPFQKRSGQHHNHHNHRTLGRGARQHQQQYNINQLLPDKDRPHYSQTQPHSQRHNQTSSSSSSRSHLAPYPLFTRSTTKSSDFLTCQRLDEVAIECIDMVQDNTTVMKPTTVKDDDDNNNNNGHNSITTGIGTDILGGIRTRGRYIPMDQKTTESVYGIVHLYRDAQETPYLSAANSDDYPVSLTGSAAARHPNSIGDSGHQWNIRNTRETLSSRQQQRNVDGSHAISISQSSSSSLPDHNQMQQQYHHHQNPDAEDCTTLCIIAVPSYMSPSDFLGFVGEKTIDEVSHFRMIKTARANRYMVLIRFRSGKKAKEWQKEWNGKVFNSMEVSYCKLNSG